MASDPRDKLLTDLEWLATSEALTDRARVAGRRLLRRLTSPVRVVLQGPDAPTAAGVLAHLEAAFVTVADPTAFSLGGPLDRADIVIWVTQSFAPAEREAWSVAPDRLKDHSFLVTCGPPPDIITELADVALDEFLAFHCLSAPGDAEGLDRLCRDLSRHIRRSTEALVDAVSLFVQKHRLKVPQAIPHAPAVAEPRPPVSTQPSKDRGGPALERAMAVLIDHSAALSNLASAAPGVICGHVFDRCTAAADDLVALLSDSPPGHPDHDALRESFFDVADNITLMALENDPGSAADAVTLLLQIRKDLSVCLAA